MAEKQEPKFEEALTRLEALVTELETGELSLEVSMRKFEEGMKLARQCADRLGETEKKVEILLKRANDVLEWQAFDRGTADAEADTGEAGT